MWRLGLVGAGAAGSAASLTLVYDGVREVLRTTGGFCASGGPYVIAQPCPPGSGRQLLVGVFGLLVFGAVWCGATSSMDGSAMAVGCLLWSALFGTLGVAFLTSGGSTFTGVMFEVMAVAGLAPAAWIAREWLRRGGAPPAPVFSEDHIVRAVVR